ncbi:JmjC domain-containing protein [Fretibacter rubidus]|uniref:JmjC domain-containing protein n=1 Tax=Fretibacter rubidus TaxID=570162 RepID=UPI00352AFF21
MQKFVFDETTAEHTTALAELLHPLDAKHFFKDYWDKQSILIQGGGHGRFHSIMTEADFVDALYKAKLSSPSLRYLQKSLGDRQESLDYFLRQKATWVEPHSTAQLAKDFHGGTMVYVAIENAVASVKSYCRSIFPDFKSQISINAYFSAGRDASAFDAHFDPQDVFILQLEGQKEWQLWNQNRVTNPISGIPKSKSVPQAKLPADETVILTPGDVLYVPRGMWHWPRLLDDNPSLHLTVTLIMPRPVDVLDWLKVVMSEDETFRASLPFSSYQDGAVERSASLNQAIRFLTETLASPEAKSIAAAYMLQKGVRSIMPTLEPTPEDNDEL